MSTDASREAAYLHKAFWDLVNGCSRALRFAEIQFNPFDSVFVVSAASPGRAPIVVRSPDVAGAMASVAAAVADHDSLTAVAPPITDTRLAEMRGELARLRYAYAKVEGTGARADNPIIKLIEISSTLLIEIERGRKA